MKLLLADDHTLFRDALVQYIERADPDVETLIAKDFYQAIEILESGEKPSLIMLDLRMPGMRGMQGLGDIRTQYPDIPVALMSGVAEPSDVKQAMNMGAIGYFPKTLSGKALIKAIQLVLTGEKFVPLDADSNTVLPSYYSDEQSNGLDPYQGLGENQNVIEGYVSDLTPREKEVLTYLARGASNKEIANDLGLQVVTVKLHVRGICRKLGVKNRTQAALKAQEIGISGQQIQ